ncbi:MAG TPA: glycosyltransferase family 39 protein [Bryobacteraceae bacterium]|nr:glycosyltransferase family 39 protein [Bryobacteraceae bacterium]
MSDIAAPSPNAGSTADRIELLLASQVDWIVILSLVLAFALRLAAAWGKYLNPDEALHHLLVNQTSLLGAYRASLTNAHPPLYFALLYYWRFIGNSEVMLRLPSVLASTAAGWMAYRWIAMVLSRAEGLITLLLTAFSPMLIGLGAEVRNYSLLLLCMASALFFLERAFRDQKVSSIAYSSLFLYLAILTHYSALWFVLAAGVYVLVRICSLKVPMRIAWMLFQAGGAAIYVWLYVVHISKMRGSPMEVEALTGWLHALYYRGGESRAAFLYRSTVGVFQFLFASDVWGVVALLLFIVGVVWLLGARAFQKRRDLASFGILLLLPFVLAMIAALLDLYPYGGTRHCTYLILFATAGISVPIAAAFRQRLAPIVLLAVLLLPYWYLHHAKDPQQMDPKEQKQELMANAIEDLQTSVPPSEPVFSDYQASIMLAYYLGRDHPPPPQRECGGVSEVQYGAYHVVILGVWSATGDQLISGLDGWRKGCGAAPRDTFWIFDAGWGTNLLDDLGPSGARSISQRQRFGETISVFKLRMDR